MARLRPKYRTPPPWARGPREPRDASNDPKPAAGDGEPTKWLGIMFDCCQVYLRIYPNKEGTAYVGRCPRCTRKLTVRIGPDGSSGRIFRAR